MGRRKVAIEVELIDGGQDGERLVSVSNGRTRARRAGAMLSARELPDGRLCLEVLRADAGVVVRAPPHLLEGVERLPSIGGTLELRVERTGSGRDWPEGRTPPAWDGAGSEPVTSGEPAHSGEEEAEEEGAIREAVDTTLDYVEALGGRPVRRGR